MQRRSRRVLMLCAAIVFAAGSGSAAARGGHGGGHGGHHGGHGGFHHFGGHSHFHPFIVGAAPFYGLAPLYPYYPYGVSYPSDLIIVTTPLYAAPVPGECQAFQGNAVFAGTVAPFFGTACFQADGAWHVLH